MGDSTESGNPNTTRQVVTLGDGKEYILSALNLNMLCDLEDLLGKPVDDLLKKPTLHVIRALLFVRLKPNHPDLTERGVGELIDTNTLEKMGEILGVR